MTDTYCPSDIRATPYPLLNDLNDECIACASECCTSNLACSPIVCNSLTVVQLLFFAATAISALFVMASLWSKGKPKTSGQLIIIYMIILSCILRVLGFSARFLYPGWPSEENRFLVTAARFWPTTLVYLSFLGLLFIWSAIFAKFEALGSLGFFTFFRRTLYVAGFVYSVGNLATPWTWGALPVTALIATTALPSLYIASPWLLYGLWRLNKEVRDTFGNVEDLRMKDSGSSQLLVRLTRLLRNAQAGVFVASLALGIFLSLVVQGIVTGSTPCEIVIALTNLVEWAFASTLLWFLRGPKSVSSSPGGTPNNAGSPLASASPPIGTPGEPNNDDSHEE